MSDKKQRCYAGMSASNVQKTPCNFKAFLRKNYTGTTLYTVRFSYNFSAFKLVEMNICFTFLSVTYNVLPPHSQHINVVKYTQVHYFNPCELSPGSSPAHTYNIPSNLLPCWPSKPLKQHDFHYYFTCLKCVLPCEKEVHLLWKFKKISSLPELNSW